MNPFTFIFELFGMFGDLVRAARSWTKAAEAASDIKSTQLVADLRRDEAKEKQGADLINSFKKKK